MTWRRRFAQTMVFGGPDRIPYHALHYRGSVVKKWIEQRLPDLLAEEFESYRLDE